MSRSPDRWLRAAAAEGLSLREAAVFASPGKSARPHYNPPPSARYSAGGSSGMGSVAAPRAATPADSRFDSFSAGEAGAEPYSARVHTVDRCRAGEAGGSAACSQEPPAPARGGGGGLDFAKLAADREAYLQVGSGARWRGGEGSGAVSQLDAGHTGRGLLGCTFRQLAAPAAWPWSWSRVRPPPHAPPPRRCCRCWRRACGCRRAARAASWRPPSCPRRRPFPPTCWRGAAAALQRPRAAPAACSRARWRPARCAGSSRGLNGMPPTISASQRTGICL